jgi:hypothetical protein
MGVNAVLTGWKSSSGTLNLSTPTWISLPSGSCDSSRSSRGNNQQQWQQNSISS